MKFTKNCNFFQRVRWFGDFGVTIGELIALLLEVLVVLIFCWVFIVGLWMVIR